jgi:hypothetical protein
MRMDDWLGNLEWYIAYRILDALRRSFAVWWRQERKRLEGHYANKRTIADHISVSDVIPQTGKLSAAEELFWWYWLIRLS